MSRGQQEKLYQAITEVDDRLVEEAFAAPLKSRRPRWGWMAACLCVGMGLLALRHLPAMGGSSGSAGVANTGHDGSSVFLDYAGPVFPLALAEDCPALTAERAVTLDFAAYIPREETLDMDGEAPYTYLRWEDDITVTDGYVLTNSGTEDVTVTALYPFAGTLRDLTARTPEVTVDGGAVEPELAIGGYTGGFAAVEGAADETERMNLRQAASWEDYKALLSDGRYQVGAFSAVPEDGTPAVVYEFTGSEAPEGYGAATVAMSFTADEEKTTVLTYGFNGGEWDRDTGWQRYSYFVPEKGQPPQRRMVILLGEDVADYTLQGYVDGGCDRELEGVSAAVTRRETTLGAVLRELAADCRAGFARSYGGDLFAAVTDDQLTQVLTAAVTSWAAETARYDGGRLDDVISDAVVMGRVFYLSFPVTVPAGGSVDVRAVMAKSASYDYYCAHTENRGIMGYDLVTRLGSGLAFTRQTASLLNTERVEIVRQNFGFDLETGILSVELDPSVEHYYLEVRRTAEEP